MDELENNEEETEIVEEEEITDVERKFIKLCVDIDLELRTQFKDKHAKAIYWRARNKEYRWIAQEIFNDETLEGTVRNYIWQVNKHFREMKFFKKVYEKRGVQPLGLVALILNDMIKHDPDNIDKQWPPPPFDYVTETIKGTNYLLAFMTPSEVMAHYIYFLDDEDLEYYTKKESL